MFYSFHLLYRGNNQIYLADFLFKIECDKLHNILCIQWVLNKYQSAVIVVIVEFGYQRFSGCKKLVLFGFSFVFSYIFRLTQSIPQQVAQHKVLWSSINRQLPFLSLEAFIFPLRIIVPRDNELHKACIRLACLL